MGRKVALIWHASMAVAAGLLYFFFVLPRWFELTGDTSATLGTILRIVCGAVVGVAAMPVVFTQLRTRKPEFTTPLLALSLRQWSIVLHVVAAVLIVGTAISEIWVDLDRFGQLLFGIYGAAAAIALLGFFSFYLSFVAELPPPPPRPIGEKKEKKSRFKRRSKDTAEDDELEHDDEVAEADNEATEDAGADDVDVPAEADADADESEDGEKVDLEKHEADVEADTAQDEAVVETADETKELATTGLRNQRPSGKSGTRRRRSRSGVAVED